MKRLYDLIFVLAAIFVFTLNFTACTNNRTSTRPSTDLPVEKTQNTATDQSIGSNGTEVVSSDLPVRKQQVINIKGEQQQITTKLFKPEDFPFYTYYPVKDFKVANLGFPQDGKKVRFVLANGGKGNAQHYLEIFYPPNQMNAETLSKTIRGEEKDINKNKTSNKSLAKTNNWRVLDSSSENNYVWAKERVNYTSQDSKDLKPTGSIIIGEENNTAFYIIQNYPQESADGLTERFNVILQNLKFEH